jgi:hypothetical protein
MKSLFNIIIGSGLALALTACGTQNDAYGNNYPNNRYPTNGTVYRANDGAVYRRGEVYRDRSGNVYQNGRIIRTGDVTGNPGILSGGNNTVFYPNTRNRQNLPPGQAKKIYGGKATDYAKGQQKKRAKQYDNWGNDNDHAYKKAKGNKGKKNHKRK